MRPRIAFALVSLLALPLAAFAQEAARPDLSGTWTINQDLSETMREKLTELALEELEDPRARARWNRAGARDRMRLGNTPFARLVIDHAEPRVTIAYRGGRLRELFTDGRELEPDPEYGVEAVTVAWEGARLIVDSDTNRGRITEFWELSTDGTRLFVTTEAEMGQRFSSPVVYRRVYDAEPAAEPEPTPEAEAETGTEDPGPDG